MALAVESFIIVECLLAVFGWRDARDGALIGEGVAKPVAIVAAVGEECSGLGQTGEQHPRAFVVAHLSGREMQQNGLASLIADGMQFGVQAAFCSSQTAGKAPF